ncbi:MAG: T9SS type A sorting domain-containing protein, partial [Ignavibacteriaceae bacterium]|nr:T9SS type A sorting domain-containing protein [Ignavibacteriaceae bacterium]
YPNPFNPTTTISWQSPFSGYQTLIIYDVLGNEIATLVDEYKPAGKYEVNFSSREITSGIYFYQLKADSFIETKKMILIK